MINKIQFIHGSIDPDGQHISFMRIAIVSLWIEEIQIVKHAALCKTSGHFGGIKFKNTNFRGFKKGGKEIQPVRLITNASQCKF